MVMKRHFLFLPLAFLLIPAIASAQNPGGVGTGLQLWLKADAGITEVSDRVSSWADQSGNSNDATQAISGQQPIHTNVNGTYMNYNPIIQFDGSNDNFVTPLSINASAFPQLSVVSIYLPLADNAAGPWGEDDGHWERYITDRSTHNNMVADGSSGITDVTNLFVANQPSITSVIYDEDVADGSSVVVNGTQQLTFTANHDPDGSAAFGVGWDGNDGSFNGYVPEIAVYNGLLTNSNRSRVESYFAIKYGVTLSGNYRASNGSVVWNATSNSNYLNDIAGIGRDDASGLNQKQSRALTGDNVLTVALGALAADNASNANTFDSDMSFLLWGHNGGDLTEIDQTADGHPVKVLSRVWVADEFGESGALEVQFDLQNATVSGTTASDFWLALDTNSDVSDGRRATIQASSFNGSVATFTGVDIEDGDILLLITDNPDDAVLPVELTSFDATYNDGSVAISWTTASETNNAGFDVERSDDNASTWTSLGFVEGQGTTESVNGYLFTDRGDFTGMHEVMYRLKQIDFDGKVAYSDPVSITLPAPEVYAVSGYPNPFNPVATIEYQVPVAGPIKVAIYDAQGRHIETLVDENQEAGRYRVTFDATGMASGLYMYRMEAGGRSWSQSMLLVK